MRCGDRNLPYEERFRAGWGTVADDEAQNLVLSGRDDAGFSEVGAEQQVGVGGLDVEDLRCASAPPDGCGISRLQGA
jgi:hypothetical protein